VLSQAPRGIEDRPSFHQQLGSNIGQYHPASGSDEKRMAEFLLKLP
jgi:hypothetical protein